MRTTRGTITAITMMITVFSEVVFFCVVSFEGGVAPANFNIEISAMVIRKMEA